jgi:pimeloyl-ACP methyl ester carboxylesterase
VPEFRRTGQPGGGWPGTFDDVAAAVDVLPGLVAAEAGISGPVRVLLAGHSAGGQLALWAASRHRLPAGSRWHTPPPQIAGVVPLAAVADLAACYQRHLGHGAVTDLLGGGPGDQPDRYASTDPARLLPTGMAVRLVHGAADDEVPPDLSTRYADRARAAGDDAVCSVVPGAGHFAVIDPLSAAWARVLTAFAELSGPASQAARRDR